MDDLISRAAAILIAERYGCNNGSALGKHSGVADCIASEIAALQAVDAVPVVHGRWNVILNPFWDAECSECGYTKKNAWEWGFCPNCGAKMDGGTEL